MSLYTKPLRALYKDSTKLLYCDCKRPVGGRITHGTVIMCASSQQTLSIHLSGPSLSGIFPHPLIQLDGDG